MSRLARVAIAITIILGGQWLASQPDIYMPIFDAIREEVIMTNDAETVEMQDDERWLVIIVEFPDDLSTSGSDHTRANAMLTGSNSAATYFSEISNGRSTLIANVQSEIHTAHHNEAAYGRDVGGERDVGDESTGGPAGLVEEALTTTFSDIDMSPFDFDNDGCRDGYEDEDDDGDGIPNSIDNCPQSIGIVNAQGCTATQSLDDENGGSSLVYYVCPVGSVVVLDPTDCPADNSNTNASQSNNDSTGEDTAFYYVCPGGTDVVEDLSECSELIGTGGTNVTLIVDPNSNESSDYSTVQTAAL